MGPGPGPGPGPRAISGLFKTANVWLGKGSVKSVWGRARGLREIGGWAGPRDASPWNRFICDTPVDSTATERRGSSRNYGICMEYVRNMYGICMEYVWNKYGICMEYV
jgi:hypothetical protein